MSDFEKQRSTVHYNLLEFFKQAIAAFLCCLQVREKSTRRVLKYLQNLKHSLNNSKNE